MIQRGNRSSLALEALCEFRLLGKMSRENFHRDAAVQTRISRSVDFTHPASTEWRLNFIRAEFGT
jgi:hypothetical protein